MENKVKARIRKWADGSVHVEAKRDKFKHWFELGQHRETDATFEQALQAGTVDWTPKIVEPPRLFWGSTQKNVKK